MARKPLVVVLPLPSHDLTLNRIGRNLGRRKILVAQHRYDASLCGLEAVPPLLRPWFPAGTKLIAWCYVERLERGQKWDLGGLVEALKPAFDGLEGIAYINDKSIVGVIVDWDEKPTGRGLVTVTFKERED